MNTAFTFDMQKQFSSTVNGMRMFWLNMHKSNLAVECQA